MCKDRTNYSPFKNAIVNYLQKMATENPEFLDKLKNPEKDIDKCLDFIVSEVKRSKRQGFADDEIFGMAIHYYEEPNEQLKIDTNQSQCKVVINQEIQLSETEKEEAKKRALKRLEDEYYNKISSKNKTKKQNLEKDLQPSLF